MEGGVCRFYDSDDGLFHVHVAVEYFGSQATGGHFQLVPDPPRLRRACFPPTTGFCPTLPSRQIR